ncbi:hypothetical protein H8E07_17575 [bacterium]|nr:hypothetical protein [bacterium]
MSFVGIVVGCFFFYKLISWEWYRRVFMDENNEANLFVGLLLVLTHYWPLLIIVFLGVLGYKFGGVMSVSADDVPRKEKPLHRTSAIVQKPTRRVNRNTQLGKAVPTSSTARFRATKQWTASRPDAQPAKNKEQLQEAINRREDVCLRCEYIKPARAIHTSRRRYTESDREAPCLHCVETTGTDVCFGCRSIDPPRCTEKSVCKPPGTCLRCDGALSSICSICLG